MVVIEGKAGKSVKLMEYIKNTYDRETTSNYISIIDYVMSGKLIFERSMKYCYIDGIAEKDYIDFFKNNQGSFKYDKVIVFYVNCNKEMINDFKALEDEIGKEIIITVQTDSDKIKIYEV